MALTPIWKKLSGFRHRARQRRHTQTPQAPPHRWERSRIAMRTSANVETAGRCVLSKYVHASKLLEARGYLEPGCRQRWTCIRRVPPRNEWRVRKRMPNYPSNLPGFQERMENLTLNGERAKRCSISTHICAPMVVSHVRGIWREIAREAFTHQYLHANSHNFHPSKHVESHQFSRGLEVSEVSAFRV